MCVCVGGDFLAPFCRRKTKNKSYAGEHGEVTLVATL